MLQVMLMTILHAHTENFQIRSWKNLDVHREIYLNGSLITQKRQIQNNAILSQAMI